MESNSLAQDFVFIAESVRMCKPVLRYRQKPA